MLRDAVFTELVNKEIKEIKMQYAVPLYTSNELDENSDIQLVIDDQLFFEVMLCKIRGLTIAYGARKKRERDTREKTLLWQMHLVEGLFGESERCRQRLNSLQQELIELRKVKLAGAAQRACARWVQQGESPTKYFCGLEKRQSAAKYINCIKDEEDLITGNDRILEYIEQHFSDMYRARAIDKLEDYMDDIGVDFPKLTPDEADRLEGPVTVKEAAQALRELNNDKSPGPDGFTVIFF